MINALMALIALSTMIASLVVVAAFVPDIDLILVVAFVSLLAIYDFWDNLKSGN
jgi:hypothetical protein